jgi:phage terminase large subunit GpA-like protein
VPDEAVVLTCGVDVQQNRLELEIVGWGKGEHRVVGKVLRLFPG